MCPVLLVNDMTTLPLNYQEPQEGNFSQSLPCTSALYCSGKREFWFRPRPHARAEQSGARLCGPSRPPGAPGPPGPPRPGPHLWDEVPGAGLRRAQLCRASPLMDAFAGTTFFSSSPGEDLQGRAVLSSLRLTRPKFQGRGRPQSLDKTPHGLGKGSPVSTQQAALVGGWELPSWLLLFLLVVGRGEGRKRLKAREAGPGSSQPACHHCQQLICFVCIYATLCHFSHVRVCDPMDCSPPGSSLHGILPEEYWSGLPFPTSGNLLDPGFKPASPALQVHSLPTEPPGKP